MTIGSKVIVVATGSVVLSTLTALWVQHRVIGDQGIELTRIRATGGIQRVPKEASNAMS